MLGDGGAGGCEMRNILVVVLLLVVTAPPVCAGAWLREKGDMFLSATATFRQIDNGPAENTLEYETGFYAEYGAAPRLTVGFDMNDRIGTAGHALAFARLPLGIDTDQTRFALELALGGHQWLGVWRPMAKAGLFIGHSFDSRWGAGWIDIGAAIEHRTGASGPLFKLDALIGLSQGGRIRPMLKVESAYLPGHAMYWSVTPAVLIDGKENKTWLIGLERKSSGNGSLGLTIGLWQRF